VTASFLGLSGGELILVLLLILILVGADKLPGLLRGLGQGIAEFKRAVDELSAEMSRALSGASGKTERSPDFSLVLWLAQGLGVGRIPFAPGTFGSLLGLLWFVILLLPGRLWFYAAGVVLGVFVSVWICGRAEQILNQTDPGSVVLDEIIATPICFGVWIGEYLSQHGAMPAPEYFFNRDTWPMTVAVFAAFRLFDVVKPWPVRQSQKLPGGWGVTMDDVLAALYVNALLALAFLRFVGR